MKAPPQTGTVRWWIRFTIGPLPVRIAIIAAFLAVAIAGFEATVLQGQADKLQRQHDQLARQQQQSNVDRNAAIYANVRARHDDCQKVNRLREGLRRIVTDTQRASPLIERKFNLPPAYLAAQDRIYHEELATFTDDDCRAYALDAVPPRDRSQVPPLSSR